MKNHKPESSGVKFDTQLRDAILQNTTVTCSLGENVIFSTEDKIELCLRKHLEKMNKKSSWVAPFGVFLTVLLTILTANFKDWYFSKDTWQAVFVIALMGSFIWLAVVLVSIFRTYKTCTLEFLMEEIKKNNIKKT